MRFAEHLEQHWPDSVHEDFASTRPQIEQLLPGFRVRRISPGRGGQSWAYATCGAAGTGGGGEVGAEYVLLAPAEDPVVVEMLAALASVSANPATRLGVGSIVALGRPWATGSHADQLLVLPPYVFGPGFETCELDDQRRVVVLWLVPITPAEARFVRKHGYRAFEELMERHGANIIDPRRPSIV